MSDNNMNMLVGIHGPITAKLPDDTNYAHLNVSLSGAPWGNDLTFVVHESDDAIAAARQLGEALLAVAARAAMNLAVRQEAASIEAEDTAVRAEMLTNIAKLDAADLEKEISFADGFGPDADTAAPLWIELLHAEAARRAASALADDEVQ